MKPFVTSIHDIAKAMGVSPSTVSRALKNHPDISQETRLRIQSYARQVNYRPNALALSLKKQRSDTIGLIIPEIQHHFFSSVISGIEELAYANGFRIMICQSNENFEREVINTQALFDHRVDGILVSLSKNSFQVDHFRNLQAHGIPVVFFDRVTEELDSDKVLTDDAGGARSVVSHMISKGCRKILHLSAPQHLVIGRERCRGYCEALVQHGIPVNEANIIQCDTRYEVDNQKNRILSLLPVIDGIFAVNDFTAIAVMQLIQEYGYQVPQQIAIAGFGDDPNASIVRPTLTTVEQKGYEIGLEAVRLLIHRINQPDDGLPMQTKIFQTTLRVRDSV